MVLILLKWQKTFGILLSEDQKAVISGHSKGEYHSSLGQIIKIAEVCKATENPRWYRGEQKPAAQSWEDVRSILKEDTSLPPQMIALAERSYGKQHFHSNDIQKDKDR